MVLLFIIDVVCQFSSDFDSSVERIVKTGFKTKSAAKAWSDKLIAANYTEHVSKNEGFRGNRYKIDRVIINYNEATSENVEIFAKIFR